MFPTLTLVAQSALFVSAANVMPSCLRIIRILECPLVAGITEAFQHHAVPWGACIAFPAGTGKGWRDVHLPCSAFSRSNASGDKANDLFLFSHTRTERGVVPRSDFKGDKRNCTGADMVRK
ncbi:hypothetical protein BC826DRAFT_182329 [Russula brevipes]|nr:hypothetical protein BC826DRAFT_182329 [Russula brevipes]